MRKLQHISILFMFLVTCLSANDWQEKLTKIKEIIDSIKIDNLSELDSIKLLDQDVQNIIQSLSDLQKQITTQKGKLEQEQLSIKILTDLHNKERSNVLETAIAELEKGIEACNDYFQKVNDGKVTNNNKDTVTKYKESWSSSLVLLKQVALSAQKIQEENENLKKQTWKDEELQEKIKNILSLINSYHQHLEAQQLTEFSSPIIAEWQKQLEVRLDRSIYASKVKVVRDSYQAWKDAQIQNSDRESELNAIKVFEGHYATHEEALRKGSENNFFETSIVTLHTEAFERRAALEKEKVLYDEINADLNQLAEVTKTKNAQKILSSAEATKKKIESYQQKILNNEISGYFRKDVAASIQNVDNAIFSAKLELDTFADIEKEYNNFKNTTYTQIQNEKSAIDSLLSKISLYATLLQTQQIKGFLAENIKLYTSEAQTRYQQIVAEQNVFSPFETALKNWQSKNSWTSAKEEEDVTQKLISLGDDYLNAYDKTSHYYEEVVKSNIATAKVNIAKINKEKELFSNVETKHQAMIGHQYTSLSEEKSEIEAFFGVVDTYKKANANSLITNYLVENINNWTKELQERLRILDNEVVAHKNTLESVEAWKSYNRENATTEKSLLEKADKAITSYNEKIAKFEITRYHQQEIMALAKDVRDRVFQIDSEQEVFNKIESASQNYNKESLETYQESIKQLKILIENYGKELEIEKISNYHKNKVEEIANTNNKLSEKLGVVANNYKDARSAYSGWENNTRWQSLEEEENEIGKIENAITLYQNSVNDITIKNSNVAEMETWKQNLDSQKARLNNEKILFEELKSISENNDEVFASSEDEQTRMDKIIELCEKHNLESKKKTITDHYQRSVKVRLRRAQDQIKKLKKEKTEFKSAEAAYNFWKTRSPWDNAEEEKAAIKDALDKVQSYNDELQFRRITNYSESKIKEFSDVLKNRQLAIAQSQ